MNRCSRHFDGRHTPSITLADTGVCDVCGETNDVWDLTLIQLYKSIGLSDCMVHRHLPRLRTSGLPGATTHSIEQINAMAEELAAANVNA